jgi:hypothetical protein
MLTGQCLCSSGISQFLDKYPDVSTPAFLVDYVRRKATVSLNLSDLSQLRFLEMCRRTATTQLIVFPRASTIILVGSLAWTVTRPPPWITQPNVSLPAPRPTSSAMANASLPARAPRAKAPPPKSAGSAAALAQKWVMAGRPAACSEGAHVPGSASTPHATWRAVSVPSLAVARNTILTILFLFLTFRWWMRPPFDALLADRPGLHCPPRCCGRLLSVWRVCCPPLHARIRPVARQHTLCLCAGSQLSASRRRARGRRGVHSGVALRTRAPTPVEEQLLVLARAVCL